MKNNCKFKVIIGDNVCKYEYMFELSNDVAIYDLAKAIAEKFDVEVPTGRFVQNVVELSSYIKDDLICNENSNQIPIRNAENDPEANASCSTSTQVH